MSSVSAVGTTVLLDNLSYLDMSAVGTLVASSADTSRRVDTSCLDMSADCTSVAAAFRSNLDTSKADNLAAVGMLAVDTEGSAADLLALCRSQTHHCWRVCMADLGYTVGLPKAHLDSDY